MPTIVSLDKSILEAAQEILAAETGWSEIARKGSNSQEIRSDLEGKLFHAPSAETLAALAHFDGQQKTVGDLQARIVCGQLNPGRLIGKRLKDLLTAPLEKAIAELELELGASIAEDSDLAEAHGMSPTAGPRSRSIAERLQVAQNTAAQVEDGGGNPLKVFGRLGHALNDQVDAEAMSTSALKAVRDTEHVLAKSA